MKQRITRRWILALLCAAACRSALPQTATFQEDRLHGRRAFVLQNNLMRVATLPGGGFIGEIRFISSDPRKSVNPMRVPHYQTIDPYAFDIAQHGALYGTGIQRRLMSGYMGDFLCFPHFGPSSKAEFALDLGQHGEALAVEWKRERVTSGDGGVTLFYSAELPKTQYRVERSLTLLANESVVYVEESIDNRAQFDRPFQWVRHVTFGPPFLEIGKTFVDAPVAKTAVREGSAVREEGWPALRLPDGQLLDQRVFSGRTGTWLLDRSQPKVWFTIYHTGYPVLLGYLYESQSNPWVLDWQENMRVKEIPWEGKVVARAVCIGNSPFASGLQDAVARGSLFGVPVYGWFGARQRLIQRYLFFLAEIPLAFKGVDSLRVDPGRIVFTERETGRAFTVEFSRDW